MTNDELIQKTKHHAINNGLDWTIVYGGDFTAAVIFGIDRWG